MTALRTALLSLPLLLATSARAETAAATPPAGPDPAIVAPPTPAAAAATVRQDRVGLGVSITSGGAGPTLYLPLDRGGLRVELEGAWQQVLDGSVDASVIRLGVGAFSLADTSAATRSYLGTRLQYLRVANAGDHAHGVRLAAVLGAEWSPVPGAALGVEGQLGYTGGDNPRPVAAGGPSRGIDTSALLFVRVFLAASSRHATSSAPPARAEAGASGAPAPAAAKPPGRCRASSDCEGLEICFDGGCRR